MSFDRVGYTHGRGVVQDAAMTAIVILGAAVWPDGPSPTLRRRCAHGAALFLAGRGDRVVVCGGLGRHPPTEAEVMAGVLTGLGVPGDAIVLEDRSTNTAENLAFAKALLDPVTEPDILIVSDAFHLPRARLLGRRLGWQVAVSAPPVQGARAWPQIKGWLREIPALAATALRLR